MACQPVQKDAINKQPINMKMNDELYAYLLKHTREPEILRKLRNETAELNGARMQISPEQGQFMAMLVPLLGATRYIEVGVFTGYSSLAVAMALPSDGRVVALDRDPVSMEVAKRYWQQAGVEDMVDARLGPGQETIRAVLEEYGPDAFDYAFVDADKRGYRDYYEVLLQLVRPGGLIAIDNVLWYGKVADRSVDDKATLAIRELNDFLLTDDRIDFNIVPIGDGIAMCRRRS